MESHPEMTDRPIPVHDNTGRRRTIERLTRRVVTACGMAILLVMMLLLFWLIWVVVPLFIAPGFQAERPIALGQNDGAVAMGMDRQQKWGWRIDNQGRGRFVPLNAEPPTAALTLLPGRIRASASMDNHSVMLLSERGTMVLVQPDFTSGAQPRWTHPLGDAPLSSGEDNIGHFALTQSAENCWQVALATPDHVALWRLQTQQPAVTYRLNISGVERLVLSPDGSKLFTLSGTQLRVWTIGSGEPRLRESLTLTEKPTDMKLLSGGTSLLIADQQGIGQWFDIASAKGPQLHFIRHFVDAQWQPLMMTEPYRRVFATLSPQGELKLFASKQQGAILSRQLIPGVQMARFAPEGDGLLVERAGSWQHYRLTNPWPDVSWRSLWHKVWYENYPEPDYVWQSTSANDNYQGKYSLVPMVVGTLKAAGLAMLFATPLALAAAIYTAWFMTPGLRRWVKPSIEMMGALPGVVIGLVAALWLAPRIADRLSGVLLLPLILAAILLLCSWVVQKLPPKWQKRWRTEGNEVLLLMPLLLLSALFSLWAIPLLEQALWGQGLAERLSADYQQRNLLVAGVAMGIALVPLIFTLSEDAIFSVPASLGQGSMALGATPWQTLMRVVLPAASSGIFAALMIGFGRAIGETMIVLMATGNTPQTDGGLFAGLRSLAANIAVEMPEAAAGSAHYRMLFLSALVLLVFTLVVNTLAELVRQRLRQRYKQLEIQ
ncbi:ABC transporter permease subunit [Erwinia piriflorinigrans]|uniref:Putative phosphate ABC transport system permease protein pstC n=1 Tax=Erwinia piriflorinigrans CFBP 5888 TaxID=1161919 RepID=V5ZAS1_9GAMM|nr:ABC transporter permease subunit [Erwinia piriflorinigrans]CCG88001.1 putative phosphate ABC transport system permease protein pstC [Erwinia piriflorinigrans CFBP 5888]